MGNFFPYTCAAKSDSSWLIILWTLLYPCRAEANAEGADSDWSKTPIGAIAKGAVHDVKEYGVVCDLAANPDVVGLAAAHQVCSCKKHYKPC